MLTNPVLDPFGKIPEFKYCAVRVTPGGDRDRRVSSFGGGQVLASSPIRRRPESGASRASDAAHLRRHRQVSTSTHTRSRGHRMPSDIEIAQKAKMLRVTEVAARARHSRGAPRALRPLQGQGLARLHRHADRPARRQADPGHRDQPDARGRRQDHHDGGPGRRAQPHRQEGGHLPARALARPRVRHEGRRRRRRLRAGGADGGHQPALHRRLQRHRARQQPARRADRQPHPPRQRARLRRAPHRLEARDGHERPRAARHRRLARRTRQRLPAPGRLRHRRRLRDHGDLLPRHQPQGPEGADLPRSSSATPATRSRFSPAT